MTKRLDSDNLPTKDYLTNWCKRALLKIKRDRGAKLELVNVEIFEQAVGKGKNLKLAPALREFASRLQFILSELETMDDQELNHEVDDLLRFVDKDLWDCTLEVRREVAPIIRSIAMEAEAAS